MRQILNRESANEFATELLKSISDISTEIYSRTKTTCATRGDEFHLFIVYDNNGKEIHTNINRIYLLASDQQNGNAIEIAAQKYADAMLKGIPVDLGPMEHIKGMIYPQLLNAEYIDSNIDSPIVKYLNKTEFALLFVYSRRDDQGCMHTVPLTHEDVDILFDGDADALAVHALNNVKKLDIGICTDMKIRNKRDARKCIYKITSKANAPFCSLGILFFSELICSIAKEPLYVFPFSPNLVYILPASLCYKKKLKEYYNKIEEIYQIQNRKGVIRLSDKIYMYKPNVGILPLS